MTGDLIDELPEPSQLHVYTWPQLVALTSFIEDAHDWEDRRLPTSLLSEANTELRNDE